MLYILIIKKVPKMNDTIVLKFGGSSVADNEKLHVVADKITNLYDKNNNIVVILSAQGKMTDKWRTKGSQRRKRRSRMHL